MSKRENIASDIITKLDAVTSPIEFKKITREPFEVEELSDAQFPAIFIQSGDETREVSSIGDTGAGTYRGTIDFLIVAFGKFLFKRLDSITNQSSICFKLSFPRTSKTNSSFLSFQMAPASN